jgi:putative ABC transport system permease protein
MNALGRDFRFAWRSLRRTPVVTLVAVLSIALGIAATTSVFSVIDAALFRPPPLKDAERLAILLNTEDRPGAPTSFARWSWPNSRIVRERARSFERVASFSQSVLALTDENPEPVTAEIVSSDYWPLLRVQPTLGRVFTSDEGEGSGDHAVAVLGYDLWQRRFGGDQSIIGRAISVNGVSLRVVGIGPKDFRGLSNRAQLWLPPAIAPSISYPGYLTTTQNFISVVGRLRDDVSLGRARAELAVIGEQFNRTMPAERARLGSRWGVTALTLNEARIDPTTRRPMLLLFLAAVCLLFLACANVAGLLLGRAVTRRREIAIRVATGASRARVIQQLIAEAALLAGSGGVVGILIASPLARQLAFPTAAARGGNFYGAVGEFANPGIDLRVLSCCVVLCAVTTLVFGLWPAIRATRVDLTSDLKDGAAGGGIAGRARVGSRAWIVAIETALAVTLLFSGGSLIASWQRMEATDLGFDRTQLLTFSIRPSEAVYPAPKAPALIDRLLSAITEIPGVESATVDGCTPLATGCANSSLHIMGRDEGPGFVAPGVLRHYIAPDHFKVLKVPLIRGRLFDSGDRAGTPRVAIINQNAAHRFWPNEDPIGKRVWFGGGSSFDRPDSSAEIVGIVGDVAYQQLDSRPFQADFYTPYKQFTFAYRFVLVRVLGDVNAIVPELRKAVRAVDPNLALFEVQSMTERMHNSWDRLSYQIRLLTTFAIVALILAATGIFAVITHSIGDRRREIGIRVALGATAEQIVALVGGHGARPALIGLAVGIVASLGIGRAMTSLVYGARPFDAPVSGAVIALTVVIVFAATYLAARKALAVQPVEALKNQ